MTIKNNKRERTLNRIKEVLAEEVPKSKLLVFRRTLYSKLNSRGVNLYERRMDKNQSLISHILDDEIDILQTVFLETLKDFNIVTKKQREKLEKYI
ncbi:hypothetical protein [Romboutsia hominis]|uniref:hypothetical protein n=1 Tax=Romboutsia hominis TaxID=1507512 RepID=UPI001F061C79|nr:hypothetical protein [Romboutsia hominis]MCH1959708.1 hypothetical protein [Romboutsia hominis]MCH1969869.1 hypothetical protein [Romboutsia hominis]